MSQARAPTSLSMPARLLCYLGPPSVILGLAYTSPKTGLLAPLTFVPTLVAYKKWHDEKNANPDGHAELEPLVWTFALSATAGFIGVSTLQALLGYGLSTALYGTGESRAFFLQEAMRASVAEVDPDIIARRAVIAKSLQYLVFNAVFWFSAAGLGEETLKYLPVMWDRRRGRAEERKPRRRAYVDYAIASSLAFGVIEGLGFILSYVKHEDSGNRLALNVFERLLLGSTGHVLMAVLSALRATRADYCGENEMSFWRIIAPSAFAHGLFDFGALAFSASDGNIGWIHPTGTKKTAIMLAMACSIWAGVAWKVRQEYRAIIGYEQQQKQE